MWINTRLTEPRKFKAIILMWYFIVATMAQYLTIPLFTRPFFPDVYFIGWCAVMVRSIVVDKKPLPYLYCWLYGLLIDIFTTSGLGLNGLIFLVLSLYIRQFDLYTLTHCLRNRVLFLLFLYMIKVTMSWIGFVWLFQTRIVSIPYASYCVTFMISMVLMESLYKHDG